MAGVCSGGHVACPDAPALLVVLVFGLGFPVAVPEALIVRLLAGSCQAGSNPADTAKCRKPPTLNSKPQTLNPKPQNPEP